MQRLRFWGVVEEISLNFASDLWAKDFLSLTPKDYCKAVNMSFLDQFLISQLLSIATELYPDDLPCPFGLNQAEPCVF
tara:strand:+ start:93 stop:326 length:234 start_codon:yes stop_codon:yes gene_type:complete